MKILLFGIISVLTFCACNAQSYYRICKEVSKLKLKELKVQKDYLSNIRKEIYNYSDALFLHGSVDTVFFLESYDIESGTFFNTIWNKKGIINYTYHAKKIRMETQTSISSSLIKLIEKWDIVTIKEKTHNKILDASTMLAIRAIVLKDENKIKLDYISFKEF